MTQELRFRTTLARYFVDKIYTGLISRARSYETGITLEGNMLEGNALPVTEVTSQN